MGRTPEQKAADEALTAAVDAAMLAYGYVEPGSVPVHYMVLVEQRIFGKNDDSPATGLVTLYKDGVMPWVSILGLLRAATLRTEHTYAEGDPDD